MKAVEYNEAKFRELLLYVAHRCEGDPMGTAGKIANLLFLMDFEAYRQLGAAITGAEYVAMPSGAIPRVFMDICDDMGCKGELKWRDRQNYGDFMADILPLRFADLTAFTGPEVGLMETALRDFAYMSADDVSALNKEFMGWKSAAPEEETIGYGMSIIARKQTSTKAHRLHLQEMKAKYGW